MREFDEPFVFLIMLYLFSYLLLSIVIALLVLIAWEFFEIYAASTKRFYIRRDKVSNSLWDLIVGLFGMIFVLLILY